MVEIVNVQNVDSSKIDEYIGRADHGDKNMLNTPAGKHGWLGNPYVVEDYGRQKSIEKFRDAFLDKLEHNERFRKSVLELEGKTLGCWCKPQSCHGDVIKEWIEEVTD